MEDLILTEEERNLILKNRKIKEQEEKLYTFYKEGTLKETCYAIIGSPKPLSEFGYGWIIPESEKQRYIKRCFVECAINLPKGTVFRAKLRKLSNNHLCEDWYCDNMDDSITSKIAYDILENIRDI